MNIELIHSLIGMQTIERQLCEIADSSFASASVAGPTADSGRLFSNVKDAWQKFLGTPQ